MNSWRLAPKRLVLALGALAFFSCAKHGQVKPPVEVPDGFSNQGEAQLQDKWWLAFEDPDLDELIEKALTDNLNLLGAWDRLDRAAAQVRKSRAGLFPSLDAEAGAGHTIAGPPTASGSNYMLGVAASYEIDVWGRVRSARDALEFTSMATEADVAAMSISISAEVAIAWYQLASLTQQLELLGQQNVTNTQMLDLVTIRFRSGQAGAADILQQEQLIETNRGQQATIQAQIDVQKHQLAILMGQSPSSVTGATPTSLAALPPIPETGLPMDLIKRRPDVVGAHLRVQAADKRVSVAIAERFPKLSLSARVNTESSPDAGDLFSNWLLNLAANLMVPIIDGGRLKADVDIAKAETGEALHKYGQTVLEALKEVEDALKNERHQLVLLASMEKQLELSTGVMERIRDNYTKGKEVFMRVLDAMLKHQALQRSYINAKFDLTRNRIALNRALAGGFELQRQSNDDEQK